MASEDTIQTPVPLVALATDSAQANESVQCGLRDMLLGWNEAARVHFRDALAYDEHCALAWMGVMLTEGASAEARQALDGLFSADVAATPMEMSLIETWLRLLSGERSGAGEEFVRRAEQYRADVYSACWAILLLHDGYDASGKALPLQERACTLAAQLYGRKPDNPYVCYLRAWVEESAPQVSDEALVAALHAVNALPEHPAPQLLLGHLLFRRGRYEDAIPYFRAAAQRAGEWRKNVPHGTLTEVKNHSLSLADTPLEIRAKLYESTSLWLISHERDSLLVQSELLSDMRALESNQVNHPGAVLLRWEAASLPLRLLMLRGALPTDAQVAAASKAAIPVHLQPGEPIAELRDCLRFCIVARQRAAAGKQKEAIRCVQAAEACLGRLNEAEEQCKEQGTYTHSAWTRAHDACSQALLAAKAAAYPDSSDIWLHSLGHAQRPSTLLMPPVLPQP